MLMSEKCSESDIEPRCVNVAEVPIAEAAHGLDHFQGRGSQR
jgi:hypothetical protein